MKKILILLFFITHMSYAKDFSQTELSIVNVTIPQIKGVSDRSGFWLGYFGSIFEESVTKEKQTNQVKNNIDIDSLIQNFAKGLESEFAALHKFKSIKIISNHKDLKNYKDWLKDQNTTYQFTPSDTSEYICEFGIKEFTVNKQFLTDEITTSIAIRIFDKKTNKIMATIEEDSYVLPPPIGDDAPVEETKKIFDDAIAELVKVITKNVVKKIDFSKL